MTSPATTLRRALLGLAALAPLATLAAFGALDLACSKRTPPAPEGSPSAAATSATTTNRAAADASGDGSASPVTAGGVAASNALGGSRPMNVLLLSIDSLRADMPWAGYERAIAPRLTALHAKSISYSRAYSTSSFTSKSIPGMLTGRYPSELARTGSFFTKYLTPADFVCKALDAEDIPCIGGHAHAYFDKGQSGFEYGFRKWQLVPGIAFDYQTDPYVTSDKLTPLAVEMLSDVSKGDRPFFAWFHYMDPHDEYKTHAESPHFGKRPRDLYDEEVFFTDLWIGKLLDFVEAQPWAARTAIIVTADHGEAFGEHGLTRHAHELYEELVHVPLFFYVPGTKPRVIDAPRGHADLAPTFVELLGAKPIEALRGTSLVAELRGGEAASRDVISDLPEDEYNERRRTLVHEKTKLIAFGNDVRFALYDLEADPKESDDLIRKRPELAEEMRRRYKEASKRIVESPPRGGIPTHDR
jgi:arylsulfatase A-like enzyme